MLDFCQADYCPTCGQPREIDPDIERDGLSLRGYTMIYNGRRHSLRPGIGKFVRALLERGAVSKEFLQLRVSPDSESNLIHVYATYLRRDLAELTGGALQLRTLHSWGYELVRVERLAA